MYLLDRIYETAVASPDKTALAYNLAPISYRDFYQRITAVRRHLAGLGVRPGGVAVLWIDNILAGWLVNMALRSEGWRTLSVRTGAELAGAAGLDVAGVFTLASEGKRVDPTVLPAAPRISVAVPPPATDEPLAPPPTAAAGGHIMLSSGTTGRYKMVPFDPGREAAAAQMAADQLSSRPAMVALFDFGLWTAMGFGAPMSLWALGEAVAIDEGGEPWRILKVKDLSHASVTPAQLAQLLSAPAGAFPRNDNLELSVVGGALSEPLYRRTVDRLTTRIVTTIGSTEGGMFARTNIQSADDLRWHQLMPNAKVEIVDENDQPVAIGQVGQVRVPQQGGVAAYMNDTDASADAFRDGYFYPGDLAMMDKRGRVAMLGRVTDVLALNGDKLPAGPYEAAIGNALGCEVCLLSEQGRSQEEELHVVVEAATRMDEGMLGAAARSHLPKFATINFHFLPQLPRNHMGKVERLKLRQMLMTRAPANAG